MDRSQIDELKAKYDLRELWPKTGRNGAAYVSPDGSYIGERCIIHEDHKPSCLIHADGYVCKGCGATGDIFTFVQIVNGVDFVEALRLLSEGHEIPAATPKVSGPKIASVKKELYFRDDIPGWYVNQMTSGDYSDLYTKTLIEKPAALSHVIGRYAIGAYTIPIYSPDNDRVVDIKVYRPKAPPNTPKLWHLSVGAQNHLYGLQFIPLADSEFVVIVGGEKDCILGHQLGLPFVTVTGGETSWQERFNRYLTRFRQVFVWLDADDAGRKGIAKVRKSMNRAIPCDWNFLWDKTAGQRKKGFDFADFIEEGGTVIEFLEMLEMAKRGLWGQVPMRQRILEKA